MRKAQRPTTPAPMTCCVLALPPGLHRIYEDALARAQAVSDRMEQLEGQLEGQPPTKRWQEQWQECLAELRAVNDLVDLLQTPIVRLVAHEQQRQRTGATLRKARLN